MFLLFKGPSPPPPPQLLKNGSLLYEFLYISEEVGAPYPHPPQFCARFCTFLEREGGGR